MTAERAAVPARPRSPTAARSRSASSAPATSWAWRPSRSTATPTPSAAHVRLADVAVRLGPAAAVRELPADRRRRRRGALATGAEAVHPGYGFLAERAAFARAVEEAGIVFVGPVVRRRSRRSATSSTRGGSRRAVGVPSVPGTLEPAPVDRPDQVAEIVATAEAHRVPAAGQGGGRRAEVAGMRRVDARRRTCPPRSRPGRARRRPRSATDRSTSSARSCPRATSRCSSSRTRTATSSRSGERDCSLQRRHQKLVEEAPAPGLTADAAARPARDWPSGSARRPALRNAATCEFLLRSGRRASGSSRSTRASRWSTA